MLTRSNKIELRDASGASRGHFDVRNRVNDLTGKEWVFATKSVIPKAYPPSLHLALRNEHGGQKPPELCAELVRTFTKTGDLVLDPFAGVGGTLLGCTLAGRRAVGIECNPRWLAIYREVCRRERVPCQDVVLGTAETVVPSLRGAAGEPFDMVLTDVPYWQMDVAEKSKGTFKRVGEEAKGVFSDKSKLGAFNDHGPATKVEWLGLLSAVFGACAAVVKHRGYVVVFVGNMYNKGEFHHLTADVARVLAATGMVMKGEIIWYDVAKRLHLYAINYEWIPSMVHQSILVFQVRRPGAPEPDGDEVRAANLARLPPR